MSNPQGQFAAKKTGRTLNEVYGLGLGSRTGQYAWPYAACAGKLSSEGIFKPRMPKEAARICKTYCEKKRKLTGGSLPNDSFREISRFPKTTTCEQECEKIAMTYRAEKRIVEGFQPTYETEQPWYVIPAVFFVTSVACLAIMAAPPRKLPGAVPLGKA